MLSRCSYQPLTRRMLPILLASSASAAWAQTVSNLTVPPDGPPQMAVLYTHGFNDDGGAWAIGEAEGGALSELRTFYQGTASDTAMRRLEDVGIESFVVQWTAASPSVFSDPYATAEEGFAFLSTEAEVKRDTDWITDSLALHNRARPGFMDVLTSTDMDILVPQFAPFESAVTAPLIPLVGEEAARQAARKAFYLGLTGIVNTYNDSGLVEEQSTDLLDLIREERAAGGLLADYRQVNIVTHSKGSLVSRVMLSKAQAAGGEDNEYIANVVYNAPPFGGCSLTELLKIMYDPVLVTRSDLANPWLAQTLDEIKDNLIGTPDFPNPRLGDQVRQLLRLLSAPFGVDFDDVEDQVPLVKNNIELLNVFAIEAFLVSELAYAPALSSAGVAGSLIVAAVNAVRPVVTAAGGIPSFPTARDDLTPEGAVHLLQLYDTATNTFQFINLGTNSPFYVTHLLWPPASYASLAADPSDIYDVGSLQGQANDTYVARGSAELLTATDAFGPAMTLGDLFDLDHGGTVIDMELVATNWISVLLAPPTTLHLDGTIETMSAANRAYAVSPATTFAFASADFDAVSGGEVVQVEAAHHQYRFVPRLVNGALPTPWEQMALGASLTFDNAVAAHGLEGMSLDLEWRAVNPRGGREMIRRASIIVAEDAPKVTDVILEGNPDEILQRQRVRFGVGAAVRSSFFDQLSHRAADLAALKANAEPDWLIRNPAAKYLAAVFDKVGSVDYAWNDPTLSSPLTQDDVNALFLVLDGLAEGPHTLTFQPFTETLGVEKRGALQSVSIFVDHTPPEHALAGLELGAIGFRVGPRTPLQYRVQDLESGGGTGNLSVFGFSNTTFAAGSTFRLGETDLLDQIKSGPGGDTLVGGFITFTAACTDHVGNAASTNVEAYFDFTAPILTNATVIGGIPTADGAQVFTNEVTLSVDVREPNASEYLSPCAALKNLQTQQAACSAPFAYEQAVGAYARYTGTVYLAKGYSGIQIVCQDVFGNASTIPLVIEYLDPPPSDREDLVVLTPRIDNENSLYYNQEGGQTNFTAGAINEVAMSYDARRVLFSSTGNGFVFGDNNQREDVYLTEQGRIRRISVGALGEQALGGDSDSPALSGDGRYAFFRSAATNLVAGTSNYNLYLKDLETGEIEVISLHYNNNPINRVAGTFDAAPTFNGRYVFFAGRNASYVNGLTDANTGLDIYMVDLDPDGNGYYFDDNYLTHAISTASASQTGNGESRAPCVSDDGRYLLFVSQATDIDADLALNGNTRDALLMKFEGSADEGSLDVTIRQTYVVNRGTVSGGNPTALGVEAACLAPDGDTVLFATRSNLDFSGDTNTEGAQTDVYSSIGESFGIAFGSRLASWQSRGVGGAPSYHPSGSPVGRLSLGSSLTPSMFYNSKIAWVSTHTNMVANDGNGLADVFVGTAGGLGVIPLDPPAPNWIASNVTSQATIQDGGVTPDGRSAWWVSTQTYTAPYTPGRSHIYLRRIDPPLQHDLTVVVEGSGIVNRSPLGSNTVSNVFRYVDADLPGDTVALEAEALSGHRFGSWAGVDEQEGGSATVWLLADRIVTASFVAAAAPLVSSLSITTMEDVVSVPTAPVITDPDPDELHALSVLSAPTSGVAAVAASGFEYSPTPDFFGLDAFTFLAVDSYGLSATGSASVAVLPVNDPPQASAAITLALQAGSLGPIVPPFTDPDPGDNHAFSIVLHPAHGVAWADASGLYYQSDPGYAGPDSLTFRVTDLAGESDTGSIQFDVLAPPPISSAAADAGLGEIAFSIDNLPPGIGYTVEYTDEMKDADWLPVPPSGQWPSTAPSFSDLLSTQRFYRVRFEVLSP